MTLVVGSVVELRPHGGGKGDCPRSARAGIVWKIERDELLWVPIANARGEQQVRHRADIRVTDVAHHAAAGFPMARPVIECRKLLRAPASVFAGRTVLGHLPPALMARIAEMQLREARTLSAEIRLGNIAPWRELREAA